MAQTALPRIRSSFESATQGLEQVASSNDEDDEEYIPESLRLFVAQAEMKQDSVLSIISNEMSGEEIEKTISEDSEATIIDPPPPSISATSGNHYCRIDERRGPRLDDTAHRKQRLTMTKRVEGSDNASHLRRLLGSSASKPKQVQQTPTRRRPLSNPVDSVGSGSLNSSTSSVHDLIVQPESSPANSSSCQTTSMEDLKRRLYSPLLPENKLSSASDDCMTGCTKLPEPDSTAPRDVLPLVKLSENPDLSMETFEEGEVPESLRFLFEQADETLRQTQQEFLEVAGGYHDSTCLIEDAGSATKLATEIKRMSPSLCDDKSVEFPLSLYAVGVVTGGSDCEAPPALEVVQRKHESIESPSNAHFEGVEKQSDLEPAIELEPNLVPVSRCNSEMNVRGLEPWEPANELEPILVPLSLCEAETYPDEETFKSCRTALLVDLTQGERGQDALDCEPVVSAPVNNIDSQRGEKDEASTGSPLDCPRSSASRSLNLARLAMIREPNTTQSTWTCVELGVRAVTSKGDFIDTLGDASTRLHLKSNEYMLVQEARACIGHNPEPDSLSNLPHQEPEVAGNASSNRTEIVSAARHGQTPSPPSADGCATKPISPRYGAHSYSDCEEARSPPEGCVAPESIPGRLSSLSGFEAVKQVARSMVSKLKERSFDRSCDIVEGDKPTGNNSSLGSFAEPHDHNDPKSDQGALSTSAVGDKDATCDKRVDDTTASTKIQVLMRTCETYPPSPPVQTSDKIPSCGSRIVTDFPLSSFPVSGVPSVDDLLPTVTLISRPQAPELQQICSGNGEVAQSPNSPLSGQFSPGPSDDNQSANFMPLCCSPAHASSNGTKVQLPEAQESESDESSIRNPPSIVQVPSPAPMQILRSPDSAAQVAACNADANAHTFESTGRAPEPCGELIAVNRVSSTLTESYSDDNQSIHDESKNSPHAQRPIETIREEMQGRELIHQDRVSRRCGEGGLQLIETNDVSANDKASAFCNDAPLFGAFAIPKSILSFVALADEMIEQQQSRFVCCSQDQFASVARDDHDPPNTVESTAFKVLEDHHSLERKDSLWNMFNGSGSSDPIPVIPVEAVLKCSRRGSSLDRSKHMFDVIVEDKMVLQNEKMSGSIDSQRTGLVNDVQLDGRTVRDECTNGEDVVEVEVELDCAAHLSNCVTRSEETNPSASPPPHCQPTFDSPSVQSLESSHGWTQNAAEDGCAVPPVDAQLDGRMARKECTNDEDVVEVELDCVAHLSNCVTQETEPSASPPPHCQPSFDSPTVQSLESSHEWTENAAEDGCAVPPVDAQLDGRMARKECTNDEDVVEVELDGVAQLSNCGTRSPETEPSASPLSHCQPSFDSPSVESLESSQGWTENAAEDGCAVPPVDALHCKPDPRFGSVESTIGVENSPGNKSTTIAADSADIVANLLVPISTCLDIAETSDEVLARCDGEHSAQLSMDNEPPAGIVNPIILKQDVSGVSSSADEHFLTVVLAEESNIETLSSDFWEHSVASPVPALDIGDVPLGDGLTVKIDKSDHRPLLEPEPLLGLPAGSDKIQGTQLSESTPNGVDCTLGTDAAIDNEVANTPDLETPRQIHKHSAERPIAVTLKSRINPEKSTSILNDATSEPKRLVTHSPRHWRSSNQKRAEEARAKAIERIRQRKHKEKKSFVVDFQEPGGVELKAKRQQYCAKEGVARALQRMKTFRKVEQANSAGQQNSNKTNSSRIEGSSQSRGRCLQAHHVDSGDHYAPRTDKKTFIESENTLTEGEFRISKKEPARIGNERCNHRMRVRPRLSFIPAPRATKDRLFCPRGKDWPTSMTQKLMATRSLDDFQCEPVSVGQMTAKVDLQPAMSFPSYMRPTKSSLAPAFRGTDIDPWLLSTSDVRVSLASSSRVLQSMLRSEHPVAMNTGLWKWYVRPLPPRASATRSI